MTERKIAVDGTGKDGTLVCWEPGGVKVDDLTAALMASNMENLDPLYSSESWALKETVHTMLESLKIKERGKPVVIYPLSSAVLGVEAVQVTKGDTENQHDHVISVVVDNGRIEIIKHNTVILPKLDAVKRDFEDLMTDQYQAQKEWHPTTSVSTVINKVILAAGGIAFRKAGGVYFIPEGKYGKFERFASHLDGIAGNLRIITTTFPLVPGDRSYNHVLSSMEAEATAAIDEVNQAIEELGDSKPREDGQRNRLDRLDSLARKLEKYETLLGVTFDALKEAAMAAKEAVLAKGAIEFCS